MSWILNSIRYMFGQSQVQSQVQEQDQDEYKKYVINAYNRLCKKKDSVMKQILDDIVCKVCANLGVKPVGAIFDRYPDM